MYGGEMKHNALPSGSVINHFMTDYELWLAPELIFGRVAKWQCDGH